MKKAEEVKIERFVSNKVGGGERGGRTRSHHALLRDTRVGQG